MLLRLLPLDGLLNGDLLLMPNFTAERSMTSKASRLCRLHVEWRCLSVLWLLPLLSLATYAQKQSKIVITPNPVDFGGVA